MNQTSLEKMELIIDSKFPHIKEFLFHKDTNKIEFEIPYNTGANWNKINSSCSQLLSGSLLHPIKRRAITFNEKHSYFKVIFDLE